jgi:hypothetical protein
MVSVLSSSAYVQWQQTKAVYLVECADGGFFSALRTLDTEWMPFENKKLNEKLSEKLKCGHQLVDAT